MPEVTVTARQPLALGTRPRAGAPAPTHLHIPGSVLRGALAAVWIAEHNAPLGRDEPPAEFVDLFERGVRFGPLFTAGSAVVPLSVLRCKYEPDNACGRVYYDEAFGQSAAECPACGGPLRRGRGEVESFGTAGARIARTTRVALADAETAEEGLLHTRDAIGHRDAANNPTRFTGRIIGGGDWLLGERRLLLGGRRSTSGLADYRGEPDRPAPAPEPTGTRLVLRMVSPAALVDSAGRPTDRPDTTLLEELLGVKVTVDRCWVRRDRVGGWNAAADLPKPDEHVVTAGSTYLLNLGGEPDPQAVRALVERGIGLRRSEGFGWIEFGPWEPHPLPEQTPGAVPDPVALGMSQMLVDLPGEHARWFANELASYQSYLSGGGQPHADLLRRPRLRTLDGRQRRNIHALLMSADQPRIAAVIDALEARIRGVLG